MNLKEGDVFTVPWRLTINATPEEMRAYTCGREEGRREILREIATIEPDSVMGDMGRCNFCEADYAANQTPQGDDVWDTFNLITHKPTCLWFRAQEAIKE